MGCVPGFLPMRFVVCYSQNNAEGIKKFSLNTFERDLDSEEVNHLFRNLINSDEALLKKTNAGKIAADSSEAGKLLRCYIEGIVGNLGVGMLAIMLHTSIIHLWTSALQGELKNDSKTLSDLSSLFQRAMKDYPLCAERIEQTDYLTDFDRQKDNFFSLCHRMSTLVERVRSFEMWIPFRYAATIIDELIVIDSANLDKEKIESVILKYVDLDINGRILSDWKESILFNGRERIIEEAFRAHKSKLFAPAIACFLTQLDHVILDIARFVNVDKKRRNANHGMVKDICRFIDKTIIWNSPITTFLEGADIGQMMYLFQLRSLVTYLRDAVFEDTVK